MRVQDMTIEELNATIKNIEAATVMTDKQKKYLEVLKKELHARWYATDFQYKQHVDCVNLLFWRSYNRKYGRKFYRV